MKPTALLPAAHINIKPRRTGRIAYIDQQKGTIIRDIRNFAVIIITNRTVLLPPCVYFVYLADKRTLDAFIQMLRAIYKNKTTFYAKA
jgi:hypothetical protein